jgi:hypothetical protein
MTEQAPPPQAVVLQMLMGMWTAQIISAVAQLGVPDRLANGAQSVDDLARDCDADRGALHRLLRAAATLQLVAEDGDKRYSLTPLGETLRSDVAGTLRDFVIAETAPGHWLPWGRLADAVRRGESMVSEALGVSDAWTYYAQHPDESRVFARAMSNLSTLVAQDVARVYDPGQAEVIVDVGGSEGVLLRAMLARVPGARGVLFDRADVVAAVKPSDRVEIVPGDFLAEVPAGDLYLLKSILHDWPDDRCEVILKNCHRAAPAGARLVVVESILPDQGPSPVSFMDMNMLVMLNGRERTFGEYTALLARCGWNVEQQIPTGGMFGVLESRKA